MMVPYDEGGKWRFCISRYSESSWDLFVHEVEVLMNCGWELHGDMKVCDGYFTQAFTRFDVPEYETGDDDDGLPLPEATNEPVQEVRNCS